MLPLFCFRSRPKYSRCSITLQPDMKLHADLAFAKSKHWCHVTRVRDVSRLTFAAILTTYTLKMSILRLLRSFWCVPLVCSLRSFLHLKNLTYINS